MRRFALHALSIAVLASSLAFAPSTAATAASCATTPSTGGDWAQHGGDLLGTRSQPLEKKLSPSSVGNLVPKWNFDVTSAGGAGNIQTIPIEAEGCVYIQTSSGGNWLFAVNADTGALVWKRQLGSGGCHNAPAVRDGKIYINDPTQHDTSGKIGPHLLILNSQTGEELVVGQEVAVEPSTGANAGCAAPIGLFENVALIGITNGENDGLRNGGFALVNATTGAFIKRTYVVPDEQATKGFGGCSIWSAWSIDPATKMAYTGTAQPSMWTGNESERCNALIKVDLNPTSATFGDIIGAMKGTVDDPPYIDVDFGSAPTIMRDSAGRQIVSALQKSGYIHGAFTRHMTHAWSTAVSPAGILLGNHTASASDGHNMFTAAAYPGQLYSINPDNGLPNWVTPIGSPIASNSVAYANGVVYYGDEKGFINAVDSSNGVPLFTRPMALDAAKCRRNQSGGVAVARNQVIMACGTAIASYGLAS